ncbi:GNAT family N-acetyltransferase [Steroidobacter denitrificans]|uniref:GNAT family N-acetyltransferase n=1 Tax=Steroidobacter denitrificans TaxID=465721 RepID=UPI0012EDA176|nr:GNAT family N-acetyltransferase [Steroidobacter denitrificans]
MSVSIRDARHSAQDRRWIQSRYPEYLEDLSRSSLNTGMFPAIDAHGERQDESMARWFADDSSHPLVILKDGRRVGFALIGRPLRHQRDQVDFRMAEFFVVLEARRLGIGREAASLIFNRFAGTWEIVEFIYNKPALEFWRSILDEYTGGRYHESSTYSEVRQRFESAGLRDPRS